MSSSSDHLCSVDLNLAKACFFEGIPEPGKPFSQPIMSSNVAELTESDLPWAEDNRHWLRRCFRVTWAGNFEPPVTGLTFF
jgi:hypothetical protein